MFVDNILGQRVLINSDATEYGIRYYLAFVNRPGISMDNNLHDNRRVDMRFRGKNNRR